MGKHKELVVILHDMDGTCKMKMGQHVCKHDKETGPVLMITDYLNAFLIYCPRCGYISRVVIWVRGILICRRLLCNNSIKVRLQENTKKTHMVSFTLKPLTGKTNHFKSVFICVIQLGYWDFN